MKNPVIPFLTNIDQDDPMLQNDENIDFIIRLTHEWHKKYYFNGSGNIIHTPDHHPDLYYDSPIPTIQ